MKKRLMILALAASLTAMSLPLEALPADTLLTKSLTDIPITAAADYDEIEDETCYTVGHYEYEGYIGSPSTERLYVGQTLDLSGWSVKPCIDLLDGEYALWGNWVSEEYPEGVKEIPLNSKGYAHCFTVDTSAVDMSTPGEYIVKIHTVPGEVETFKSREKYKDGYRDGNSYTLTMVDHTVEVPVTVLAIPDPELHIGIDSPMVGETRDFDVCAVYGTNLASTVITVEPEGILEIGKTEYVKEESSYFAKERMRTAFKALKPGTVTITATNADGISTSRTVTVGDPAFSFRGISDEIESGWHSSAEFYCDPDLNVTFTVSDESGIKLGNIYSNDCSRGINFYGEKPGNYTLTAQAEDGRTASYQITVIDPEQQKTESSTTAETGTLDPTEPVDTSGQTDAAEQGTETTEPVTLSKGDANGDSAIDILDVIKLNRYLLGSDNLTPAQKTAADVDGNDTVDSNDSLMLLKYVVEMIDSFDTSGKGTEAEKAMMLAKPDYPEIPDYPKEYFDDSYYTWENAVNELRKQPEGYQDGFDTFFSNSAPVFLSNDGTENRVYSPLSLYMALGMSAEITDGTSRQQILDALSQKDMETLRSHAKSIWQANYMDDGMAKCLLSTSLWTNNKFSYQEDTLNTLAQNYYASVFTGTPGDADYDKMLQNWLNEQTGGMLEDYVSGIKMDPETVLSLASTIDYCGKWHDKFDKELTESGMFHSANGSKNCDFMKERRDMTYIWGEHFGSINLELENNGYMRLILPDEGVTPEQLLSEQEALDYMMNRSTADHSKYTTVNMSIPKFDVSSSIDLKEGLQKLGVTDVFNMEKSDFTPLTDETKDIWLSKAEQDARVTIDEEGCKASALTVMELAGAPRPDGEVEFNLDRPFLFEIVSATGLPLFVGIVNNASK